jgi:hypothetical protein
VVDNIVIPLQYHISGSKRGGGRGTVGKRGITLCCGMKGGCGGAEGRAHVWRVVVVVAWQWQWQ